jgi:hypothetical protein
MTSGGLGSDTFQLVIKSDGGRPSTYVPMILFSRKQIVPLVDAVCEALDM